MRPNPAPMTFSGMASSWLEIEPDGRPMIGQSGVVPQTRASMPVDPTAVYDISRATQTTSGLILAAADG